MHLTLGLLQYFSAMLVFVSAEGGNQLLSLLHNEISQQKMKVQQGMSRLYEIIFYNIKSITKDK